MKKHLILSALALYSASFAVAATLTAEPTVTDASKYTTNNKFQGFTTDFNNNATFKLDETTLDSLSGYSNLTLTSIELLWYPDETVEDIFLAVYKVDTARGSGPADWSYDYAGKSGTVSLNSDHTLGTFTFSEGVSVDATATYAFFYAPTNTTDAELDVATLSGIRSYIDWTKGAGMYESSSGLTNGNSYAIWTDGVNANRTGVATYTFSATEAVPEPATATLSLLALAGLAARRRRK